MIFLKLLIIVGLLIDTKKEGDVDYLRFLNSINPSGVVMMYSNPFSISCVALLLSVVAVHVHSSEVDRYSADSRFM